MTQAALQYRAFIEEIKKYGFVYTVQDSGGIPCPVGDSGKRAMPFWSTENRVQIIIKNVPAYQSMNVKNIILSEFQSKWLPGLKRDGLLVGCNWSGDRATGYDIDPDSILQSIAAV